MQGQHRIRTTLVVSTEAAWLHFSKSISSDQDIETVLLKTDRRRDTELEIVLFTTGN